MKIYVADFETTVEEEVDKQKETEVWGFGIAELWDEFDNVYVDNSIEKFIAFLTMQKEKHIVCYFVNLKFDGTFLMSYFINNGFKTAFDPETKKFVLNKDLNDRDLTYTITDLGVWYGITVKIGKKIIEFRDLIKLLPFGVKKLGECFDCKHKKLDMKYTGNMKANGEITPEQEAYIINDILVPKEALEKFLSEMDYKSNPPITLGQAAMREYKKIWKFGDWSTYFPNLAEIPVPDVNRYNCKNADAFCRKAYGGGWCYADERFTGRVNGKTKVYDANSLFASVMHSSNKKPIGNKFPVGQPHFFDDWQTLVDHNKDSYYYFVQFRCKFQLKNGYLPFVQIKNDFNYRSNENLATSSRDRYGYYRPELRPTLLMNETTFKMFIECYKITEFEFLNGCWFHVEHGIFDTYVEHFKQMKIKADKEKNEVRRTISKLFLCILYGKFGTAPENGFFICNKADKEEEDVYYHIEEGEDKPPVFVPIASAITSYARQFTIRAAILNERKYPKSFRYSDTDSLHLCLPEGCEPVGINIHPTEFSCWKLEGEYEHSLFVRQKTYVEWSDSAKNPEDRIYNVKASGLPDRGKDLFIASIIGKQEDLDGILEINGERYDLTFEESLFLDERRTPKDFCQGLKIPGKLKPKKIKGGCVLVNDNFTIL